MRALTLTVLAAIVIASGAAMLAMLQAGQAGDSLPQESNVDKPKPSVSRSGYAVARLSADKVAELAKRLTPEQYRVTQKSGTEAAFCGNLVDNHKEGTYTCIVCGLPLFRSADKFDSGTGWPSFFQPFDRDHIAYIRDDGHGMQRIEIQCARCGAHLGHVFEDGPKPTGLRYCLNSAALDFVEKGRPRPNQRISHALPFGKNQEFRGGGIIQTHPVNEEPFWTKSLGQLR